MKIVKKKNVKDEIRGELNNAITMWSSSSKDIQTGETRNYINGKNAFIRFEIAERLSRQIPDEITEITRRWFDEIKRKGQKLHDIASDEIAIPISCFKVVGRISSLITDTNTLLEGLDEEPFDEDIISLNVATKDYDCTKRKIKNAIGKKDELTDCRPAGHLENAEIKVSRREIAAKYSRRQIDIIHRDETSKEKEERGKK